MTTMDDAELGELNPDEPNAAQEYRALVRALRRKRGFGLFFVQASPAKGQEILTDLRRDLPQKKVAEIAIGRTDERLFEQLEAVWEQGKVDLFWIEGLEQSLLGYEDMQRLAGWDEQDLMTYSWKDVPPILSHLNLGRERFEARFDCAVVFVVPLFVVKYLLRRAGDFFDWKSGFFEFPADRQALADRIIEDGDYAKYLKLYAAERLEKILQIKDLLDSEEVEVNRRASLLREIGHLFEASKEYEQAETSYGQVIKLKPDFDQAWNDRGNTFRKLGRYESAIESYKQAIKLNPQNSSAYNNLGSTYYAQEEYELAAIAYQQSIELNPNFARSYNNLGNTHYAQKNYESAIRSYLQAIELDQTSAYPHDGLGNIYQKQKLYGQAAVSYHRAIELDPKFACPYDSLGNLYQEQKFYDQAILAYKKAIDLDPKFPAPHNGLGIAYTHKNDYEDAILAYSRAIELNLKYSAAYNNLGIIYAHKKYYEKAIANFHKALELNLEKGLDLKIGTIYHNLSIVYLNQQQLKQAISAHQKAIELNPKYGRHIQANFGAIQGKKRIDRWEDIHEIATEISRAENLNLELSHTERNPQSYEIVNNDAIWGLDSSDPKLVNYGARHASGSEYSKHELAMSGKTFAGPEGAGSSFDIKEQDVHSSSFEFMDDF